MEGLDYTLLYQAYSAKDRNPAVGPKTMFMILTYACSQNIYSSRKKEILSLLLFTKEREPRSITIN